MGGPGLGDDDWFGAFAIVLVAVIALLVAVTFTWLLWWAFGLNGPLGLAVGCLLTWLATVEVHRRISP